MLYCHWSRNARYIHIFFYTPRVASFSFSPHDLLFTCPQGDRPIRDPLRLPNDQHNGRPGNISTNCWFPCCQSRQRVWTLFRLSRSSLIIVSFLFINHIILLYPCKLHAHSHKLALWAHNQIYIHSTTVTLSL